MANVTDSVKQGYMDWLDTQDWSFWCTGTTPYTLTLKSARRLAERYYDILDRTMNRNVSMTMFWIAEPFDLKEGQHLHWLMKMEPELPYADMYSLWQQATGTKNVSTHRKKGRNWSRIQIERYKEGKGASGYCSKYIMKAHADYDILTKRFD